MRNYELANLHKAGSERLLETIRSLRVAIDQYRYLPFLLSQNRDVKQLLLVPDADNQVRVSRLLEQTNLVAGSAALLILDEQGDIVAYSNWRKILRYLVIVIGMLLFIERRSLANKGLTLSLINRL